MKLILQNHCDNEFLPGCEWTVVDLDPDLMGVIETRGKAFRQMKAKDDSLWQTRFWDWRPTCINAFEALDAVVPKDASMSFNEWIEDADGWVLVDALVIPDKEIVSTDLRTMTIGVDGKDIEVGWVCNLKDGPDIIRTAVVNFSQLRERIDG